MQAALCYAQSFPSITTTRTSFARWLKPSSKINITLPSPHTPRSQVMARASPENSTVDYTSKTSVFPAEACETIGGDACDAEIFPEVKLKAEDGSTKAKITQESVDREYLEYNEPKTVFPDEACDDLGGEFCQPEYQKGVY
ncbi:light-regulated protein-like [Thalictrum thalictroides]|uniref:Light-regulated protein-like n=1 Tax=Thalictrum thalictroides TaxID=46969 RepID=A0A7J6VRW4_THATH|nr:light-regulated protein-like [Thalictrum thalictroides]